MIVIGPTLTPLCSHNLSLHLVLLNRSDSLRPFSFSLVRLFVLVLLINAFAYSIFDIFLVFESSEENRQSVWWSFLNAEDGLAQATTFPSMSRSITLPGPGHMSTSYSDLQHVYNPYEVTGNNYWLQSYSAVTFSGFLDWYYPQPQPQPGYQYQYSPTVIPVGTWRVSCHTSRYDSAGRVIGQFSFDGYAPAVNSNYPSIYPYVANFVSADSFGSVAGMILSPGGNSVYGRIFFGSGVSNPELGACQIGGPYEGYFYPSSGTFSDTPMSVISNPLQPYGEYTIDYLQQTWNFYFP